MSAKKPGKTDKDSVRTLSDVDEAERVLLEARIARDKALVAKIVSAISLADLVSAGVRFSPAWTYDYQSKCRKALDAEREVQSKVNTLKRVVQKYNASRGVEDDPDPEED